MSDMKMIPNWRRIRNNPDVKKRLEQRCHLVRYIREYFWEQDFFETETPTLVDVPSMEPFLDPFKTRLIAENGSSSDAYLITSPEYAMKKLLVGGMENIFQVTRSYRNRETLSRQHNPEFTILEWYRAHSTYEQIMRDTEWLVASVAQKLLGTLQISYQGAPMDLSLPWKRTSYAEALEKYAQLKYDDIESPDALKAVMRSRGYRFEDTEDWDSLITRLFVQEVEPKLGRGKPEILFDYPASQASLSTISPADHRFAQRFEAFSCGLELCNAFNELTDAEEQYQRLSEEHELRVAMGKDDFAVDMSFIEALRTGMPPSGGSALGVDRLAMLLLDSPAMGDIVWLPWYEMFHL